MSVITITKENFEQEVINSEQPVLVDFWASWCGPCKMLAPVIDEIAGEVRDAKVGKVNVDEQGELAARFGVMSIPTLIVFKNGEVAAKTVGVQPKQAVLDMLK
ncbi:MAG: thioredoxin [Oscillospiraceae bacterium]|nr:thioredoxin [Oscillospiraceae bacterium]